MQTGTSTMPCGRCLPLSHCLPISNRLADALVKLCCTTPADPVPGLSPPRKRSPCEEAFVAMYFLSGPASYLTTNKVSALWTWLFIASKIPELGDTAFIVLRKQKLIFLHWCANYFLIQ